MLSVIICTHNPRPPYLARVLHALREQTLTRDKWELLVIDNASREPLSERLDLSWHGASRVIREDRLGLTPARLRGIREAGGELLVFVDDDNVLDRDYLEVAARVASQKTFLGAWSGQSIPEFERTPPEWTRPYWGFLALREFDHDLWSNLPRLGHTIPYGTGLCVRKEVGHQYVLLNETGRRSFQLDRAGGSLVSGGDNDLAACACDVGLGVGIIAALRLTHLIPPERLTMDYLARLAEGTYLSGTILDFFRMPPAEFARNRVRWHHYLRPLLRRTPCRRIDFYCVVGRAKGLKIAKGLKGDSIYGS